MQSGGGGGGTSSVARNCTDKHPRILLAEFRLETQFRTIHEGEGGTCVKHGSRRFKVPFLSVQESRHGSRVVTP